MRWARVVALLLAGFLDAASASAAAAAAAAAVAPGHRRLDLSDSIHRRADGGKGDSGNSLLYINSSPALTFRYTTAHAVFSNWIGVWKADARAATRPREDSAVARNFARGVEGEVRITAASSSSGLAAGKYLAFLFSQGLPVAGPVEFELAGSDSDPCRDLDLAKYCTDHNRCIPPHALCQGECSGGQKRCFDGCIAQDDFCNPAAFGACPAAKPSVWQGGMCCDGGREGTQGGENCIPQTLPCNPELGKECFGKCVSKHDFCHGDAFGVCPAAKPSIWQGGVCCNGGSDGTPGGENCSPQKPPCNPKAGRECSGKCVSKTSTC
ncbi:uncharacterized protein MAM_06746 [Metarhizium album ARSEF 1941]|uniref:Uncharacterized protein n=1 Tax=Metarhizium album (strain ARSEF 1941) TaxID=1081103 RepID=A0A0B2WP70_METAS|nr:uncharacterized protein MAM_06746 [Metarhizium album ARSEF 1941]KHN95469.1 hypothetical protein MAM_06746 [Metarhizium album ARSEF 1941]